MTQSKTLNITDIRVGGLAKGGSEIIRSGEGTVGLARSSGGGARRRLDRAENVRERIVGCRCFFLCKDNNLVIMSKDGHTVQLTLGAPHVENVLRVGRRSTSRRLRLGLGHIDHERIVDRSLAAAARGGHR